MLLFLSIFIAVVTFYNEGIDLDFSVLQENKLVKKFLLKSMMLYILIKNLVVIFLLQNLKLNHSIRNLNGEIQMVKKYIFNSGLLFLSSVIILSLDDPSIK
jgi:hypothetical protein